jgi:hypothetical protein
VPNVRRDGSRKAAVHSVAASVVGESETYVKAIADAIADLARQGFATQFEVDDAGVQCHACRSRCSATDVGWLTQVEVSSATGERTTVVCGLRCPICGARGTATATAEQWDRRRLRHDGR